MEPRPVVVRVLEEPRVRAQRLSQGVVLSQTLALYLSVVLDTRSLNHFTIYNHTTTPPSLLNMPSFTLRAFIAAALLLANTSTAFPLYKREPQWSFDLFPTEQCGETGDMYSGSGSTGCRADLNNEAGAYRLNTLAKGCTIEFYDNTMCDETTTVGMAGPIEETDTCRIPTQQQRFGSYQVTCRDANELK